MKFEITKQELKNLYELGIELLNKTGKNYDNNHITIDLRFDTNIFHVSMHGLGKFQYSETFSINELIKNDIIFALKSKLERRNENLEYISMEILCRNYLNQITINYDVYYDLSYLN